MEQENNQNTVSLLDMEIEIDQTTSTPTTCLAQQTIQLAGRVQGIGLRPAIYRLASELGLEGYVMNHGNGVEVHLKGEQAGIAQFYTQLTDTLPALGQLEQMAFVEEPSCPADIWPAPGFHILNSQEESIIGEYLLPVSDYGLCAACELELNDPGSRRYQFPFINCTECGPRFSTLRHYPLDRANSSYADHPPCEHCETEHRDPTNRRFHAQNICCPECGPELRFVTEDLTVHDSQLVIELCMEYLEAGKVVAIKGSNAYRLICDAGNEDAVAQLRLRKQRPDKPFAVMVERLDNTIKQATRQLLESQQRPIVIVSADADRQRTLGIAENVAPGLNLLGLMLPATGLEYLLMQSWGRPIVATSANLSGLPLISDEKEAENQLGNIADAFLHHDLRIENRLDDTVYRETTDSPLLLRPGRGYSPTVTELPFSLPEPVIALGANIKNTVALAWGNRLLCSGYLGNMTTLENWQRVLDAIDLLQKLSGQKAEHFLVDSHPGFTSHALIQQTDFSHSEILHHHAHASLLALQIPVSETALVFSWDGTGLGEEKALWGGEGFIGQAGHWRRVSSVLPFMLPGGDRATEEVTRIAQSLCEQADVSVAEQGFIQPVISEILQSRFNCPTTSSIGRLFDGAAALLGLTRQVSYDGQAAMLLESLASQCDEIEVPAVELSLLADNSLQLIDWRPLISMLLSTRYSPAARAFAFHQSLADVLLLISETVSNSEQFRYVGFSGGVFQNVLLRQLIETRFASSRWQAVFPQAPCNDSGISIGQIIEFGARLNA